ncbi:hypothetical protein KIN20_010827 [Parelaphostrongylus tenuis]|uniref:Uncharacterized protein n=1 Tax=Parelaphostrongylus tenuis TaxID=148309 RepID=A0AAD5QM25_PARTN|nr:hypothetical protein KIN20_010827 [Parelaphostrongylus tenuis]
MQRPWAQGREAANRSDRVVYGRSPITPGNKMSKNLADDDFFGIQCLSSDRRTYSTVRAHVAQWLEVLCVAHEAVEVTLLEKRRQIRSQHENPQNHKRIKRKDRAILHEENTDFYTEMSAVKGPRNESFPNDYDAEVIHPSEEETGWDKIRRQFIPVWMMSPDELVDLMVNRVLIKNGWKYRFIMLQIVFYK